MTPWVLAAPRAHRGDLVLLCLHNAGGAATAYCGWHDAMPGIEVWPVQLPGRENRLAERPLTSVGAIVAGLMGSVVPALDRPFAVFGHSFGALCAFELCRALRGRRPVHLFTSAHRAPHLPDRGQVLHTQPDAAFVRELGRLGGTPDAVLEHPELMALLVPAMRADYTASETWRYVAGAPLSVPITALGGSDDPDVSVEELAGWAVHIAAPFSRHVLPGGHFFVHSAADRVRHLVASALLEESHVHVAP